MPYLHGNLDDSPSPKKITVPEAYPGTVSENRETVSAKVKTILGNEQTAIAKQDSISEKLGTAVSDMKTIQKIQKHQQK